MRPESYHDAYSHGNADELADVYGQPDADTDRYNYADGDADSHIQPDTDNFTNTYHDSYQRHDQPGSR